MSKSSTLGLALAVLIIGGMWCRWEEWSYTDRGGASLFQYRGLLLPWQEVQAPAAVSPVVGVSVQKWSCYGFNRYDYTGPQAPIADATAARVKL